MKKQKMNSNDTLKMEKEINKKKWLLWHWHYIFLFLFLVFIGAGFFNYYNEETIVSHFNSFSIMPTGNTTAQTQVAIIGQYKTEGGGFVVGNKITINAILLLNKEIYQNLKTFYHSSPGLVIIENSEDPKDANKDISNNFERLGWNESMKEGFVNPGTLEIVDFLDNDNTLKLKGDVIFTKEGYLSFGMPIASLIGNKEIGIYVSPAYVKYQIESNKKTELLTFITIAISFLALFFGFRNQKIS